MKPMNSVSRCPWVRVCGGFASAGHGVFSELVKGAGQTCQS